MWPIAAGRPGRPGLASVDAAVHHVVAAAVDDGRAVAGDEGVRQLARPELVALAAGRRDPGVRFHPYDITEATMNAQFFKALAERALKTFAQTLAATLVAGGTDLFSVGWKQALSLAGMAALLSVLSSFGSTLAGDPASPSLVGEGETPDAVTAVRTGRSGL